MDDKSSVNSSLPLEEALTKHILNSIFPVTGLDSSYFPKFMSYFWTRYPHGKRLSEAEIYDLCFSVVDNLYRMNGTEISQDTPKPSLRASSKISSDVDEELVLSMLFKTEQSFTPMAPDYAIKFSKKRDYTQLLQELISRSSITEEVLKAYIKTWQLNPKHLNRKSFPSGINATSLQNFVDTLAITYPFLFTDPVYRYTFLRTLYYIFYKRSASLQDCSLLLSLESRDGRYSKGWIMMDFGQPTHVHYLANVEEKFDFKEGKLLSSSQIFASGELSSLIEGERFPTKLIEAQVIVERLKFRVSHELPQTSHDQSNGTSNSNGTKEWKNFTKQKRSNAFLQQPQLSSKSDLVSLSSSMQIPTNKRSIGARRSNSDISLSLRKVAAPSKRAASVGAANGVSRSFQNFLEDHMQSGSPSPLSPGTPGTPTGQGGTPPFMPQVLNQLASLSTASPPLPTVTSPPIPTSHHVHNMNGFSFGSHRNLHKAASFHSGVPSTSLNVPELFASLSEPASALATPSPLLSPPTVLPNAFTQNQSDPFTPQIASEADILELFNMLDSTQQTAILGSINEADMKADHIPHPEVPQETLISVLDLQNIEKVNSMVATATYRNTYVHIKLLKEMSEQDQKIFKEELASISTIPEHIHVLKYFGKCVYDHKEFLVAEKVAHSLEEIIDKKEQIPIMNIILLAKGLASGMAHLASVGIIHRDLTPRNVLVTEELVVKIGDFGLNRYLASEEQYQAARNASKMPLKWIAIEALTDNPQWTTACDVWSFGILLWQMIYLEEPYKNMDAITSAIEVTKGLRPPITKSCPPILAALIKSCLSTNPSARPNFKMIFDHLDLYQKQLDDRNWYYPSFDRQHAEALLSGIHKDAAVFMIRKSPDGQTLTLSRFHKEKVVHDRITSKGGKFYLDGSNEAYCSLYDIAASSACLNFEPVGFATNYATSFKTS